MGAKHDVIIAGGGHNGLVAGGYLAKAGLNVCVVEHQPYFGGGVITLECTLPGFKHDICSTMHPIISANPLITQDELGLQSKFGLKYLVKEHFNSAIFSDGESCHFYKSVDKTCESIARYSQHDADAYRAFQKTSEGMFNLLATGLYNPPVPFGSFASLLDSSPEGQDILRLSMMDGLTLLNELFEDDRTKITFYRFIGEGLIRGETLGSGMFIILFVCLMHKHGGIFPQGGSGELSKSLGRCIEHCGGTIRLSSTVKKFKISGGRVVGVILESGEEIEADKAVMTNFNIKQIPAMIQDAKDVPQRFFSGVKNTTHSEFGGMNCHLALNEAPHYTTSEEANGAAMIQLLPASLTEYINLHRGLTYGIPNTEEAALICLSKFDPTRAPEGKHTLYFFNFQPFELREGGAAAWDEKKEEVYRKQLEVLRGHTDNMGDDNILGVKIFSPLDYERHNPAWPKGDYGHIGPYMWQTNSFRPIAGYGHYRMPVDGLYLCGPSTHPGFTVTGGGRAAVQVVFEDLGLDFEKVASK